MTAPRTLHLDWRGKPDLSRSAEFYSIYNTHKSRPETGNPNGRVLVAMAATVLIGPSGAPSVDQPFNYGLYMLAAHYGALTDRVVWSNEFGYKTLLIDLTKRGMVRGVLSLIDTFFPWADAIHFDYASAWSWKFPDMADTDAAWDNAYNGLFNAIREKGKLVLAQQFRETAATTGASGLFLEQSPTQFGQTFDSHAKDIIAFRDLVKRVDGRETLFVAELREVAKFPSWYVDEMKRWAIKNDIVVSFGRDASAGVGLA